MMKDRVITNSLRTIRRSISRFIPLLVMSLLGVFVFAGLQSTKPDMIQTLDNFLDQYHVYDLKVISTMGLTLSDQEAISKVEGVKEVEGSYDTDVLIAENEDEYVMHISSLPQNINQIELIEGRFPQSNHEIVVEENLLSKTSFQIGDTLSFASDNLIENSFQIVGTVKSGLYFSNASLNQNRGTTAIGTGVIHFYAYVPMDSFDQNYYSSFYITVNDAIGETTSTKAYKELVEKVKKNLETIKNEQEEKRYEEILGQYQSILSQDVSSPKMLDSISKPTWYLYDRMDHQTYMDYVDDTSSVDNLSKIFPIVFFAVAILVSLISMNRMVEEDRVEIGTFKSLGFSNGKIMLKYLLFSFIATILGGIIGSLLGIWIIPTLIFNIYGMLFDLPNFQVMIDLSIISLSLLVSVICVCATTALTVMKVLKEKPSDLMRMKAPKIGKRVLLERWRGLWSHLSFSNKVTIRNLFRYKKRGIVTIVGIAGCSALMLCGFGVRDAIVDIASMQYEKTFQFDAAVYLKDTTKERIDEIFKEENVKEIFPAMNVALETDNISVSLLIPETKEALSNIVNLVDASTNQSTKLEENQVFITDKLADLLKIKENDTISLMDVNHVQYEFQVAKIVKNYIGHYIYMDKETYESKGFTYQNNVIYLKTGTLTKVQQDALATHLVSNEEVLYVSFASSLIESASDMLRSLNKVVVILILLAASLSFVVLYNLSNININERKREISTLKVLGFYDKEVDRYITKENMIFTIFGIFIGLVFGYFLTSLVIGTVEIDKARFLHHISLESYIYTSIISILFTIIVNGITHFKLKKIDMIASLKSVD